MSAESGKIAFVFRERSFDGKDFAAFFREVAAKMRGRAWFMLLDNACIHHVKTLKAEAERARKARGS